MIMSFGIVDRQGKRFYCLYPNVCQDEAMRLMQRDGGVLIDIDEVPDVEFKYSLKASAVDSAELPSVRLMERSFLDSDSNNGFASGEICDKKDGPYLIRQVFEFVPDDDVHSKLFIEVYDAIVAKSAACAENYAQRMARIMVEMGYFNEDIGKPGRLQCKRLSAVAILPDTWLDKPSIIEVGLTPW